MGISDGSVRLIAQRWSLFNEGQHSHHIH